MTDEITFTLPFAMPSLNVAFRTHWAKRAKDTGALRLQIMAAIGGPRHFPAEPWRRAHVTIERRGRRLLDADNLAGSCKSIVDCLCVQSRTHPTGLGIVVDDRPELMTMEFRQAVSRPQQTVVTIRNLEPKNV